jgi:hypothetical protein
MRFRAWDIIGIIHSVYRASLFRVGRSNWAVGEDQLFKEKS